MAPPKSLYVTGRRFTIFLAMAVQVVAATTCYAEYGRADLVNVPITRLIANLEEQAKQKPKDARLRLNLARVHAMAYARKTDTAQVNRHKKEFGAWFGNEPKHVPFEPVKKSTDKKKLRVAKEHLAKAIERYEEAVKLDAKNLTAQLGLAWCIDQSGNKERAIEAYRKVATTGWEQESKVEYGMLGGRFIAIEAGEYLKRLLDPRKLRDRQKIKLLDARAQYLMQLPRFITPIIVPLDNDVPLDEMIDREAKVVFDADGSGLRRKWTWITPKAGWLVYDQQGTGKITSALQMLGNVTFMLFWENGYRALASLDDNWDGELAGAELEHLAIWQDANGNGQSEPDEVKPLAEWEIVAVNCNGRMRHDVEEVAAYAPRGVRFADGHYRLTYDIMLHSAARSPSGVAAHTAPSIAKYHPMDEKPSRRQRR
jgi:tetratricopeptide (TPR) repeat protein